jgi:hypothetical protein
MCVIPFKFRCPDYAEENNIFDTANPLAAFNVVCMQRQHLKTD